MALRLEELAKTVDQVLLDPSATVADVERACEDGRARHVAAVCVPPFCVQRASRLLRGCDVKVGTVVGHPFGTDVTRAKVCAAEHAIAHGADELDVALNVAALRSGELGLVRDELVAFVRAVRMKGVNAGRGLVLVKVSVECGLLDEKQKRLVCRLVEDAGADFVSAMSGFGEAAPSPDDVELFRESVSDGVGVKAMGVIATCDDAETMIAAGASRLGTEHVDAILAGFSGVRKAS